MRITASVPVLLLGVLALTGCETSLHLEYGPGQVRTVTGRGMVVSEAPIASAVGADVLRAGGNSVDAAIATAFALQVTYPQAGPVGGGGFAVVSLPSGQAFALDFRETAPADATAEMFIGPDGKVDRDLALSSALAVGVPGGVAGLADLHRQFGRLPWSRLVEPAVRLAADGFAIPGDLADGLNDMRKRLSADPDAAAVFARSWSAGDRLVQPALARTLEAIRDRGAPGFYEGSVASAIAAKVAAGDGVLTATDLAGYRPVRRDPARFAIAGDHEVLTMPLPSSAGVTLDQILTIHEMAGGTRTRPVSPDRIHLFVESERRAFADRNAHLGDPAGVPEEVVWRLTSEEYLRERARTVDPDRASASFETAPGSVGPEETTHLCVLDGEGGAVAMTVSLNRSFGTGILAAGVLLNDHMDDFTLKSGAANEYGLRQGASNGIVPGRRPLSSMSPTIVRSGDGVVLVVGAAGGPRILSAVAQVVVRHVNDGLPLDVAVLAPRVHHQHTPDVLWYEDARVVWPGGRSRTDLEIGESTIADLRRRGHLTHPREGTVGRLTAISRNAATGGVRGVAGPRTKGAAVAE